MTNTRDDALRDLYTLTLTPGAAQLLLAMSALGVSSAVPGLSADSLRAIVMNARTLRELVLSRRVTPADYDYLTAQMAALSRAIPGAPVLDPVGTEPHGIFELLNDDTTTTEEGSAT